MTKRIFVILFTAIFLCQLASFGAPEKPEIINGDFEDSIIAFTGTSIYTEVIYEGLASGWINSPRFTDEEDIYHCSEYMYTVSLVEGEMYDFKLNIRGFDVSENNASIRARYNSGDARIYFDISNIGTEWTELTSSFVAGTTGEYDIGINVYTGELGALVDNIRIEHSGEKPEKMEIFGHKNIYVPEIGYRTYTYTAAAVDKKGNVVPVIEGGVTYENLPDGVTVSDDGKTITVNSEAHEGDKFTVKTIVSAQNAGLKQGEIEVFLGNNVIDNGDFSDLPYATGFSTECGSMEIIDTPKGNVAKLFGKYKEGEYVSTLTTERTYVLYPGKMYVLRATVYSDGESHEFGATASKGIVDENGNVTFDIKDISGNETDICTVLRVENEGIYRLKFNFVNQDNEAVYVRNIGVFIEESKPSEILIKAPAHISLPKEEMQIPIICAARDQEGVLIEEVDGISLRIEEKQGVVIKDNTLVVTPTVKAGKIEIIAESADKKISKRVSVSISDESIGDGSFERNNPGKWVSTASPSELVFTNEKYNDFDFSGEYAAKLTLNGSVSAVLFDSVNVYKAGQVYVFGGDFKTYTNASTMLSVLLCEVSDIYYTNTIPLLQTVIDNGEIKNVFIPNRDITGRIMLGFNTLDESDNQQIVFDGIYTDKAQVFCEDVKISGYPYEGMVVSGKHKFTSNFNATEVSTYRWLSCPTKDGMYMPIEGERGETLALSENLIDKYIKFEVTPISLNGPVFGESKASAPVLISKMPSGGGVKLPEDMESDEIVFEESQDEKTEITTGLNVVNIYSQSFSLKNEFVDIQNHWAKKDIDIMSACSIANGMENMLFMPDELITRAQFSAFIIRAFSLAPLHYSGTYDDVKSWDWYSGAVETVTKYAIANGVSHNLFAPDEPVTREQMTVMVARSLRLSGINIENAEMADYGDYNEISDYAREYVDIASKCGIITGFPDGSFRGDKNATRAEAIVIIKRMIEYILNNK